jgi:hypothetical protein
MVRYYRGMISGLAAGVLGTMLVVAALDPRVSSRISRRGRGLFKDCKRKIMDLKEMHF